MASIDLTNVGLTFTVRQSRKLSLKEFVINGMFLASRNPIVRVPALVDISFSAHDGERIGIIGHNGAGKSTMLRLLAGVYPPTTGKREVTGKICSLFEISLGFEMDATGRDNIRYRSYLQGETSHTLRAKQPEIEEFSELGDFLDTPVRYYSAGMLVRLAFSIATAMEPEILLVDEVLSVGDLAFQMKAEARMRKMMERSRLMVMVSHDLASVKKLCNRAIWMEHGHMKMMGPADQVVEAYKASVTAPPSEPLAAAA
jgi:ABC-type polysaccharide/polyol phosphate transport system ATPase subunit